MGEGKRKNTSKGKNKLPPPEITPSKKSELPKKWSKISTTWKIIGALILLAGGFLTALQIYDRYHPPKEKLVRAKTQREKFDELYIDSTLKPPKFTDSPYIVLETPPIFTHYVKDLYPTIKGIKLKGDSTFPFVVFYFGNAVVMCPRGNLDLGIRLALPIHKKCDSSSYIYFGVKDNRMYVSVEFKDLVKEETIGVIEYNHWRLYMPNMFDFKNTDEKLEVIDRQHNIVFSIKFQIGLKKANTVIVSGYFINPYSVSILSYKDIQKLSDGQILKGKDTCINKSNQDWKQKAAVLISDIKTIFP